MSSQTQNPVRVAVVGCGAVSELYYAPALRELEKVGSLQVIALVDPNTDRTNALRVHFPAARSFTDTSELVREKVDLAIVASPPRFHATQTIQLLQSGIHVLCEKPMAASMEEAESMIAAADTTGRVLAVGLFRRFFPSSQTIREILSRGTIGEIRSFHFAEGGAFRWPVKSEAYFQRSSSVGGVLMDIGSHLLDLMIWWLGEPADVHYEDDAMGGVEVNCLIRMKFAKGYSGEVRLSRDCRLSNRCVINGTDGWISCNANEADKLQLHLGGNTQALECRLHEIDDVGRHPGLGQRVRNSQRSFIAQAQNVAAAVRGTEKVFVSGRDALASMRLIERCYRQRKLMSMGWLAGNEQARAMELRRGATSC